MQFINKIQKVIADADAQRLTVERRTAQRLADCLPKNGKYDHIIERLYERGVPKSIIVGTDIEFKLEAALSHVAPVYRTQQTEGIIFSWIEHGLATDPKFKFNPFDTDPYAEPQIELGAPQIRYEG